MAVSFSQNPQLNTISNSKGMSVTIMDVGATIFSLKVPVQGEAAPREVVLGLDDPEKWDTQH